MAKLLLDARPDLIDEVDVYGKTALYLACEKGNKKMVRFLLDRHATVNIQGPNLYTPLLVAVEAVAQNALKISMIESLLRSGADPKLCDTQGRTAFDATHHAGLAARANTSRYVDQVATAWRVRCPAPSQGHRHSPPPE